MNNDLQPLGNAEPPSVTATAAASESAQARPVRLRVMYVEDDRINALLFAEALRLCEGVELRLAEDGEEALLLVSEWTPDVLVLDAHLPDMNGFALLAALRRQPGLHSTPAFMCSADAMPEHLTRAAAAGFVGYWTKPVDIGKVMADLQRFSGCSRLPPTA